VGNYILAEGLYRAMIDPFCSLGELSIEQQRSLLRELQLTAIQSYQVQGLTRPGGSYRDAEGNKGRFEFQLQCYGRTFCVKGNPVKKEIEGPHGRTIWYTEDQLFMPRTERCDGIDNTDDDEKKTIDGLDSKAVQVVAQSSDRMVVDAMETGIFTKPTANALQRKATALNATSTAPKTITATIDPAGQLEAGLIDVGWRKALGNVLHSEEFRQLANFLHEERSQGVKVYPPEDEVFAALNLCPLDSVKVVIVGQDPYHGPGQGHGLSFSVRPGVKPPPSLQNIFKEAQADVGVDLPRSGHLTCWAEQGVLLLNAVLTVRAGEANSHAKRGWEQFTDAIIRTLSDEKEDIVFLLWGRPAHLKASSVGETRHTMIRTSHPSPLGASKTNAPFLGSRCFSRANSALEAAGKDPIDWSVREA
jgi:uracil-DNA glycosylase